MSQILVVDDEAGIRELLREILNDEGYEVQLAENAAQARACREAARPDLVLLDIWMPDTDGITLLREWKASGHLTMPVVMMSGHGTIDTAVEATRIGAFDFLEKPISMQKLLVTVERAVKKGALFFQPGNDLSALGNSQVIVTLRQRLNQLLPVRNSVFLVAESGAGAEICARYLHQPETPWVVVEDSSILVDDPIAVASSARDGVIFIDGVQRLSRLEQKGLMLVMGKRDRYNFRVVASAPVSLSSLTGEGFDPGLANTLSGVTLVVPPLREHRDDIPEIANAMLAAHCAGGAQRHFSAAAINLLRTADWSGNLKQLEDAVGTLVLSVAEGEISADDVTRTLAQFGGTASIHDSTALPLDLPLREAREAFERVYFEYHIARAQGNMSRVAENVGLERTHLYRKLKQLGLRYARRAAGAREGE